MQVRILKKGPPIYTPPILATRTVSPLDKRHLSPRNKKLPTKIVAIMAISAAFMTHACAQPSHRSLGHDGTTAFIAHSCAASAINATVGNLPPDIASPYNFWGHVKGGLDDIAKDVSPKPGAVAGPWPEARGLQPHRKSPNSRQKFLITGP